MFMNINSNNVILLCTGTLSWSDSSKKFLSSCNCLSINRAVDSKTSWCDKGDNPVVDIKDVISPEINQTY